MAKFCTNCGKELPENAAMCVKCGTMVNGSTNNTNNTNNTNTTNNQKPNKKKGLPTWAIVLIVVGCIILIPVILLGIIGIIGYNAIKDTDLEDYIKDNINDIEDYIKDDMENGIKDQVGTIGDTLRADDFNITLAEALKYNTIDSSYSTMQAEEGKEFLVLFFDVENISDDKEFISTLDFDGYADGYEVSPKIFSGKIDNIEVLTSNLEAGMKTKGLIVFELDKNWQNFEIHYGDFDYDLVFKVVNDTSNQGA